MEPPSHHQIAVLNESDRRIPRSLIARAVATTLALHGRAQEIVSVLICDDEGIQDLNRRFRGIDKPTDVLSFPYDQVAAGRALRQECDPLPTENVRRASPAATFPFGDIAIALPYAERQAKVRRVSLSQELGYLAIHGTLHLLGFDDENEKERARMVQEMNKAAISAGLKPDEEWASLLHESQSANGKSKRACVE